MSGSSLPSGCPWHAEAWQALATAWRRGQLPHALLLSGPAGLGKRRFAAAAAGLVLCAADGSASRPCGRCRGCRLLAAGTHPDLFALTVEEGRQNIAVDSVRQLCRSLALKSSAAGYKIAIVAPAELLSIAAANSLLKTLEEPTPGTLLIVVCAQPARLPPTIVSRCLRLRFVPPPIDWSAEWLAGGHGEADWPRLLRLAYGAPLAALALKDADFLDIDRSLSVDLRGIAARRQNPLDVAARWKSYDLALVLNWLHGCVCDLVRSRIGGEQVACSQVVADLQRRVQGSTLTSLFDYLDKIQSLRRLVDTPMNRQLALEDLLIPWCDRLAAVGPVHED